MKRYFLLIYAMFCILQMNQAQSKLVGYENFDGGNISFTSPTSTNLWRVNTDYFINSPNSYHGLLPTNINDSIVLETPFYDFTWIGQNQLYVQLRFDHICKIASTDVLRIEYKENAVGAVWKEISVDDYEGSASNYNTLKGFNSSSYPQWRTSEQNLSPNMSWWKREVFDFASSAVAQAEVQFRFILKHGSQQGTHTSFGWLIDNFEVVMDTIPIAQPTIEFLAPLVLDTLYDAGPFEITANVKSNSTASLRGTLNLGYTTDRFNTTHSVQMTSAGQDTWKATIPIVAINTEVIYYIEAEDTLGNKNRVQSAYFVKQDPNKGYGQNSVSLLSIDAPTQDMLTTGGTTENVIISFQNEGAANLDSVIINWKVNGVLKTPFVWKGNIPWKARVDSLTIGSFTTTVAGYDTIVVWLSNPNNVTDPVSNDDTLTSILYGCGESFEGVYQIGETGNAFPSIEEALKLMQFCGVTDNVEFHLQDGTYEENIDLQNFNDILGGHSLRFTALNDKEDAIIQPLSGFGVRLGNVDNITIDNLTIDASDINAYLVNFTGDVNNILIDSCILKMNYSGSSESSGIGVYQASRLGSSIKNVRISNNTIQGGHTGIYLLTGGNNVTIENNIIEDSYNYGIYLSNLKPVNISYNSIKSRTSGNINIAWQGISISSSSGQINGNKILQRSNTITQPTGLYISVFNDENLSGQGLVTNNEIIVFSTSGYYGIRLSGTTNASFLHNSVYAGGTGSMYALQIQYTSGINAEIKNNIFYTEGDRSYPIYLQNFTESLDINYNNYYSKGSYKYIGYVSGAKNTLGTWSGVVTSDQNSENENPKFEKDSGNLILPNITDFDCPVLPNVKQDINKVPRIGITTKGCYADTVLTTDAALTEIINFGKNRSVGAKDTLMLVLTNGGKDILTAATIDWEFNTTNRSSVNLTKQLAYGESDTLELGEIIYLSGDNKVSTYISGLGVLTDDYLKNDTIISELFVCDTAFSGTYIVGETGVFTTLKEAVNRVYTCGIKGDVILALQDQEYEESVKFDGVIQGTELGYTVTITSLLGDRDNVVIIPDAKRAGISFKECSNISVENITIDLTKRGNNAIQFERGTENITINNNILKADTTTSSSDIILIQKANTTGVANNIQISNNILEGGYAGISFYAGTGNSEYGTGISIDSNIVRNQYRYAIRCLNIDFEKIANNIILSRETSTGTDWAGIQVESGNGAILANTIKQRTPYITSPQGIYLKFYNCYLTNESGLVANNEIILFSTTTSAGSYGGIYMYDEYGVNNDGLIKANIFHNSIYVGGLGIISAISGPRSYGRLVHLNIQNNNLIANTPTGYPIYLRNIDYVHNWTIDNNNYYSPNFIGYAGADMTTYSQWNGIVTSDRNSSNLLPDFTDVANNLHYEGAEYGLGCAILPEVATDILGTPRNAYTTKGAYHFEQPNLDITLDYGGSPNQTGMVGASENISVIIRNLGFTEVTTADIYYSINGASPSVYPWTGNLFHRQSSVAIPLGNFQLQANENIIKVWTANPNNSTDAYPQNDTLYLSALACNAGLEGTFTVGTGGDFTSIDKAMEIVDMCGIANHVTFSMLPGTYNPIELNGIQGLNESATLTINSYSRNPQDVVFEHVVLSDIEYVTIENITVIPNDATNAAIRLHGDVANINITGCEIFLSRLATDTTKSGSFGIWRSSSSKADNIRITGNTIYEGYAAVYMQGAAGSYISNLIIDNNTFINQAYYGGYLGYTNFESVSNNTILSRESIFASYWYGLYLANSNGTIVDANRIRQRADNQCFWNLPGNSQWFYPRTGANIE
jgi:hypothetical protein